MLVLAGMVLFLAYAISPRPLLTPRPAAPAVATVDASRASAANAAAAVTEQAPPTEPAAEPTAAPAPSSGAGLRTYVVKSGDTLWAISRSHNLTVDDLVKANNLPDRGAIRTGQSLVIPPPRT